MAKLNKTRRAPQSNPGGKDLDCICAFEHEKRVAASLSLLHRYAPPNYGVSK